MDARARVVLPDKFRQGLVHLAEAGRPNEVCGLLSGRATSNPAGWRIEGVHALRNVAAKPRRSFRLDPTEQRRLTLAVEAAGGEIIGVYHSHPTGPGVPSAEDLSAAELLPHRWCHLLVGADGTVRAWLLGPSADGEISAAELVIVTADADGDPAGGAPGS